MSFSQTFFSKSIMFEIPKFRGNENLDRGLLSPKNSNILPMHVSSYSCPKSQFFFTIFVFFHCNYSHHEIQIPFKVPNMETFCQAQLICQFSSLSEKQSSNGSVLNFLAIFSRKPFFLGYFFLTVQFAIYH